MANRHQNHQMEKSSESVRVGSQLSFRSVDMTIL
jgi:hypothetical protein